MSELIKTQNDIEKRTKETVTFEVKQLFNQARNTILYYYVEIGRGLCELKELCEHGEWGSYIQDNFQISQSTANNFMRIFNEYGADQIALTGFNLKSQSFANLSLSQALSLLAIEEDKREDFVEKHNPEDLSTREFKKAVEEATQKAQEAESKAEKLQENIKQKEKEYNSLEEKFDAVQNSMQKQIEALKTEITQKENKLAELEISAKNENEISDEIKEQIASEAKEKMQLEVASLTKKLEALTFEKTDLEKRIKASSDKTLIKLDVHFNNIQDEFKKILDLITKIDDIEKADKIKQAVSKIFTELASKIIN